MNGIEKIAYNNTRNGFEYIVGGWYNCIQDDCPQYIPNTKREAIDEIYYSVLQNRYAPGYEGYDKAPREMRFAGEKFVKECIEQMFDNDSDIKEIAEIKEW